MATVLVVDDEPMVRDVVARYLTREGYSVLEADDGAVAQQIIDSTPLDLVVLDLMLPGVGGLDLCRWIREESSLPVILLTARTEEADRIVGLELGADDYVTKPFSPRELVARVRSVLRRSNAAPVSPGPLSAATPTGGHRGEATDPDELTLSGLTVNPATRRVTVRGASVTLTAKEFDLLWFLASHQGLVFTRGQLLTQVWGFDSTVIVGTATVTVHIRRLREKIEVDPSHPCFITTVRGVGYRFEP